MTTPTSATPDALEQRKPTVLSIDSDAFIQKCLREDDSEQLDEADLREWCRWNSKSRDLREKQGSSKTMAELIAVSKNWDRVLLSRHDAPLKLTPSSTPIAALKHIFETGYAVATKQDASEQVVEADVWSEETVEVAHKSAVSELISGNNEVFVVPTVLLRRFSKFISAQSASIDAFKIKVPCMRLSSCSFVKKYLCGRNAVNMITTADPVDAIDVAIIAERLEIPALFYLALHTIHEHMVTMVRYPNRAMFVHVFTHCMSDSPLKDFMLSLLYRHLFVLGRSELEWRHIDGKGVPITSKDLLPGMWLTELRLKIGGHLRLPEIEPNDPTHWGQPDCKAESMLTRKNLKHFIEGIETAQENDLIDQAPIVAYYLNTLLQESATRCMYSCFSSLLHWDRVCSLPLKRPIVVFQAASTASAPAPAPAATSEKPVTLTPVSMKLKRKADGPVSTAPISKRLATDNSLKKKAICPRKGVGRHFKTVSVVCRDRATLSVDRALLQAASKVAARQLQHNLGQTVMEFPDMDVADFERLKYCMDKPGVLPNMESWSLRQKLSTVVSADAIEASAIAVLLRRVVEQLFRGELMCFAVAIFVHRRSKPDSKLRVFVVDCMHWVLMKNGRVEKLKEECERNKAMVLYSDLAGADKKHGSGDHPCKEMRWELAEPCVCAETITVVKVGR